LATKDKPKSRPKSKSKSIPDVYIYGGIAVVGVLGVGAYLISQDPTLIQKLLGQPQPQQQPVIPTQDLEKEEQEALERGLNPYGMQNSGVPGGFGSGISQIPQRIGGGHVGETQEATGPFGLRAPVPGGPGAGGFTPSRRCNFNPADLTPATLETAKQYVRILDFPITPITNVIPRLEQCYYREIANYVNAGPTNPVYFAVEQAACAISSGAPFPIRNSATLKAAQVAKRHINQGNCYNSTLLPVPKRFNPVPVLETARAKAMRARALRAKKAAMAKYSYFAHGGE
jgi:hypothetical protein